MIEAERIGKRYGDRWIFRGVSFYVGQGECLLVTGANGAGKSTLLRMIAGLEPPSEGSVGGAATVGYCSPELRLYPMLSAEEHLQLAGNLRGIPASCGLLDRVGLHAKARDRVSTYSTGMRSRLKFALAIQQRPELLVLDEPGAGLDKGGRALLDELVDEQRKRGAIVLATNDPAERRFGDLELRLD
ncbi:MAG TPA: ABC transporter ATP-binding protein [Fimbriimonadales bacterium]|jgi:ABC-type multidrug transport system ATPase subunit|nr:ABC transporter ATP-binding protein [Fimbriimonadales bacterium]